MMKLKLNNKGYMLVEIILASALAFGLAFFIIDLTIRLKNKNDDLMVETLMNTDRTIINNKLMSYAKDEEGSFDCGKLIIEENIIKYNGEVIDNITKYGVIKDEVDFNNEKYCSTKNGKITINIPMTIPQMADKEYSIVFDYKYNMADDKAPEVKVEASYSAGIITGTIKEIKDDSGYLNIYGYLLQNNDKCPEETNKYEKSSQMTHDFTVAQTGTYYVCVEVFDLVGNAAHQASNPVEVKDFCPSFTYSGTYEKITEGTSCKIKFKSSGDLVLKSDANIDIFVVGGGGGGGSDCSSSPGNYCQAGGGGGGGYATTYLNQVINAGTYKISIGSGGTQGKAGTESYFGSSSTYSAGGGQAGTSSSGGNGGSGGGSASCCRMNTSVNFYSTSGSGGQYGSNGGNCSSDCPYRGNSSGGSGQANLTCQYPDGTTYKCGSTCEFSEGTSNGCVSGVSAYSRGGRGSAVKANSGNGGNPGGSGSSGIVIIRSRVINDVIVNDTKIGTYTGRFEVVSENSTDWKIKFLTNGNLVLDSQMNVDLFLVGGGGGGGISCSSSPGNYCQAGGGGGGGYTKTYLDQTIKAGTYKISIGSGGFQGSPGDESYFGSSSTYSAGGGKAGTSSSGGDGGSGGGSATCCRMNTSVNFYSIRSNGGSYGNNGLSCSADCPYHGGSSGGTGQGYSTCEFELGTSSGCNSGVTAYSQGGTGSTISANSGNGGNVEGNGSSGIIIMRNKR